VGLTIAISHGLFSVGEKLKLVPTEHTKSRVGPLHCPGCTAMGGNSSKKA